MTKFRGAVLGLFGGYLAGAAAGWLATIVLSGNTHDKSLEAVMTAAFVAGPAGAILGLIVGLMMGRRRGE